MLSYHFIIICYELIFVGLIHSEKEFERFTIFQNNILPQQFYAPLHILPCGLEDEPQVERGKAIVGRNRKDLGKHIAGLFVPEIQN